MSSGTKRSGISGKQPVLTSLLALLVKAEILKRTEDTVLIGVASELEWRQLQHPGKKKTIQRALSQVAGRPVELQVVSVEKAV